MRAAAVLQLQSTPDVVELALAVCDHPMPALQHDHLLTLVADGHTISKKVLTQLRP